MSDFVNENNSNALAKIVARLRSESMTRIIALGSSNTERAHHSAGCLNWVDWIDLGIHGAYGRVHHTINSGVCGQTTADVKQRFERDALSYNPNVVFLTLGGNDCNPERNISLADFENNLKELVSRLAALAGCTVILQTYYEIDRDALAREGQQARADSFYDYMNVTRKVAAATGTCLIDNLSRWSRLRAADSQTYLSLMRDAMHVNPLGNMVWGLDVVDWLGGKVATAEFDDCMKSRFARAQEVRTLMDSLA
jgi:lysophospholipase L1-like esterase